MNRNNVEKLQLWEWCRGNILQWLSELFISDKWHVVEFSWNVKWQGREWRRTSLRWSRTVRI